MIGRVARTRLLVSTVVGGGVISVAAVFAVFPPAFHGGLAMRAMTLGLITMVAELISIRLQHGSQSELITLTEVALVADIVLLPPPVAVAVAVGGLAAALLIQRRTPVKLLFNLAQYALGIVVAVALYHGVGGGAFATTRGVIALGLGMTAFSGINLVTISAILAATQDRPFLSVLGEERGLSLALGVGCSSIGIVAVSQYLSRPLLVPLVLAPTLAVHLAFRGWVKQKRMAGRLEEEKTKLERVLEHSSEGIVLADGDGTVVLWSPSMERMTGIGATDARGKSLAFLLRGRGADGRAVAVESATVADGFELEIITPAGEARWLSGKHGPALGENGALLFDVLVLNDVTRRREVDRLKSDFISTVSHELRTPLTPIKGFAHLLLRRGDELPPERRREALTSILERTDHMTRLVEDLLLVSSMSRDGERGLPDLERHPIDVTAMLDNAVAPFALRHPHREFVVDAPAGLVACGDPLRAEQMLAHLVSNAVKFSDDATPVCVTVTAEAEHARIAVVDEGRGIPDDKLEEIFAKFKRLEDPLRMETGGAGLGLFMARELARAMGADIAVESRQGIGSSFIVRIPLLAGSVAEPARAAG